MTHEAPTPNHQETLQVASARLEEFPGDPLAAAAAAAKEVRMEEMGNWANGIGAHVERRAAAHHTVTKALIDEAKQGTYNEEQAIDRLRMAGTMWRTGVKVNEEGNIKVHDHYPYSGDTPVGGWHEYRSPVNVRKRK